MLTTGWCDSPPYCFIDKLELYGKIIKNCLNDKKNKEVTMNYYFSILIFILLCSAPIQSMSWWGTMQNYVKVGKAYTSGLSLAWAADKGDLASVQKYLSDGAPHHEGIRLAFKRAVDLGHAEIAELLMKQTNIDINDIRENKSSLFNYPFEYPLESAASINDKKMVQLLLRYKVDIKRGNPLKVAAKEGYHEMVMLLLSKGVPINDN